MPLRRIVIFTGILVLLASMVRAATGPAEIVRSASDEVLVILQDKTLSRDQRWEKISVILSDSFDFEGISRSVLAAKWHDVREEEQREFVTYFSQYLEEVYRTRIEEYNDQEIRIDGEKLYGNRAVVDTTIVSTDAAVPVSYRMRQKDGKWVVYDVQIEGQSMVSSYRSTFSAITQSSGMQGLLADVKRRIEKHRQAREAGTQ